VTDDQASQHDDDTSLPPVSDMAIGFVQIATPLPPDIDRKLKYLADARYVLFYFEPRGEEVVWNDGRSHGFALGGWRVFMETITPLADLYRVTLGSGNAVGTHVLLLDRLKHDAFFAEREQAEAFVSEHRQFVAYS